MKFKAFATKVVSVEPGRAETRGGRVFVEAEPLSTIEDVEQGRNCVVVSLESGPQGTITDHAFNRQQARALLVGLVGSLNASGDPFARKVTKGMEKVDYG